MKVKRTPKKFSLLENQRNEISECLIYRRLATIEKDAHNREVLFQLADDEEKHYEIFKRYSGQEIEPNHWQVRFYYLMARLLGLTFTIKLMEAREGISSRNYSRLTQYPDLQALAQEEEQHEQRLISLINEERLAYMGSVVLGLNDALVEFTGALAGFTLALNDARLIALTGSITGIAAALSMASSEYLSTKSEKRAGKHPVKAAVYTGITYLVTVVALVLPFIWISTPVTALVVMLAIALLIIALFNYYYAIARGECFRKRFAEMAVLSFTVAGISFLIGYLLKLSTGIDS